MPLAMPPPRNTMHADSPASTHRPLANTARQPAPLALLTRAPRIALGATQTDLHDTQWIKRTDLVPCVPVAPAPPQPPPPSAECSECSEHSQVLPRAQASRGAGASCMAGRGHTRLPPGAGGGGGWARALCPNSRGGRGLAARPLHKMERGSPRTVGPSAIPHLWVLVRCLGARPLQQRQVAAFRSSHAGRLVPQGGRGLGARPLQQRQVAAFRSSHAGRLVPPGGRGLGARPL